MSGLVLLASYPKSGNTWTRAFLASLALGGRTPDLNSEVTRIKSPVTPARFNILAGVDATDLSREEILALRPRAMLELARRSPGVPVKIHDACLVPPGVSAHPFPPEAVRMVIHIVRDPRAVAVSRAHHLGISIEAAVDRMADESLAIGRGTGSNSKQVEQFLSSWSGHVASWLDSGLPTLTVRYEDLIDAPQRAFGAVAAAMGLRVPAEILERAVAAVAFDRLAEQEAQAGFKERHANATAPFFRRGKSDWREELPATLARRIERDHGQVMRRMNYL